MSVTQFLVSSVNPAHHFQEPVPIPRDIHRTLTPCYGSLRAQIPHTSPSQSERTSIQTTKTPFWGAFPLLFWDRCPTPQNRYCLSVSSTVWAAPLPPILWEPNPHWSQPILQMIGIYGSCCSCHHQTRCMLHYISMEEWSPAICCCDPQQSI